MKKITVDINEIFRYLPHDRYHTKLDLKFKGSGWEGIPPVPLIEIPGELRTGTEKFMMTNGNYRVNSAERAGLNYILALQYGPGDDIQKVMEMTGGGNVLYPNECLDILRRRTLRSFDNHP